MHRFPHLRIGLLGGAFAVPLLLLLLVASSLWSYHRLGHEGLVAEISFVQLGPERYRATLRLPEGRVEDYVLEGDDWQLDARVIKWKGWANLLGMDAVYRLERLSGRYSEPEKERHRPPSLHQLAPDAVLDLWVLARRHGNWLPFFDSAYGSSVYLPMEDGAAYLVTISQTGLLARPIAVGRRQAG